MMVSGKKVSRTITSDQTKTAAITISRKASPLRPRRHVNTLQMTHTTAKIRRTGRATRMTLTIGSELTAAGEAEVGIVTVKQAPPRGLSVTVAVPLWSSATCLTIARPNPEPPASRLRASSSRANRLKTWMRWSCGTPGPSTCSQRLVSAVRERRLQRIGVR